MPGALEPIWRTGIYNKDKCRRKKMMTKQIYTKNAVEKTTLCYLITLFEKKQKLYKRKDEKKS